ncbi:DUF6881 domain-containing protein [Hyalangium versicolor]|uniref:DUF6881 domain-containing protein n=1 Tax=Hyalangium versicolor TaxID=2861190 RepID=UPI001CCE4F2A|nr:hypothetical protein [Hyalangium versicolor]
MKYLKVHWHHSSADTPVLLYSELDAERWEVHKVEVYRDGRHEFACDSVTTGSTRLGEVPVPPLEEIASDPEFSPTEISKEEFEKVWDRLEL